jgi:hypothetical protein
MVMVPKPCLVLFKRLYIIVRYSMRWKEIGQGEKWSFLQIHIELPGIFNP